MNTLSKTAREQPFSYTCNCCSHCCKEKIIRVNPYETARLSSHLHINTSYFLKAYTWAAGTILKVPYRGYCIFRNYSGCSVHGDRPLVCRLYPLRRSISDDGIESFALLEFEPGCIAFHGDQETIADYLSDQGAGEYLEAMDRYLDLTDKFVDTLHHMTGEDPRFTEEVTRSLTAPSVTGEEPVPGWLDMDPVNSGYCAHTGTRRPKSLREKMNMHITAIESWLAGMSDIEGGRGSFCGNTRLLSSLKGGPAHVADKLIRVKTVARTLAVLAYSIGVNLDELSREEFGAGEEADTHMQRSRNNT